jgi:hypothetical protein
MIAKSREMPLMLKKLQVLHQRVHPNHPKYALISERLAKYLAGYKGECSIDYPLSLIPDHKFIILHNIRLRIDDHYFQIDTLLLYQNFIVILEVKNIAGTIFFDQDFHQLIQTFDGVEKALPDPFIQTSRHEQQLAKWLAYNHFPDVPILSLVLISNPSTLIRSTPNHRLAQHKVIHRDYLPKKLLLLEEQYRRVFLSEKELKKMSKLLNKQDVSLDSPILEIYEVLEVEIIKGVRCTKCLAFSMKRIYGTWYCPECKVKSKDAHILALRDYQLLFGPYITNSKARSFLQVSSPFITTRLLRSATNLTTGTTKGRIYTLSLERNHTKLL